AISFRLVSCQGRYHPIRVHSAAHFAMKIKGQMGEALEICFRQSTLQTKQFVRSFKLGKSNRCRHIGHAVVVTYSVVPIFSSRHDSMSAQTSTRINQPTIAR